MNRKAMMMVDPGPNRATAKFAATIAAKYKNTVILIPTFLDVEKHPSWLVLLSQVSRSAPFPSLTNFNFSWYSAINARYSF